MISKKNFAKVSATLGAVALGVSATATAANADTIYTVQSGDTLSGISYKFAKDNSMINDLAKKNNIQDINKIFVGQKLIIKSDGEIQEYNAQNAANANVANNNTQATQQQTTQAQPQQAQSQANQSYTSNASGSEAAAKAWIAGRESGGNYNATNGQYIGKYQLSASYLGGDYSPANQERVADQYVASRYGSWTAAQQFWQANGWY
ncbi:LysM peptidoglycan-binding domain-containing protein [Limosilactobacillus sp. RRLNB_1_1]|uniref:LysM peptidoglycan-binding domain-containing protein n=1 Tax=Limosilactobacillus albertensis TaxID=2759752 RepID=A0A7W3TTU6_9LACO|nr:LysM peptidoglycan-binding domain-containing protein [Limosilactobacillus albertensis]MBB1070770.1 LysM peptidoglycan-binding domain-containing protein [Limosilactobacillus albertensis]MBB1122589.1 LysM peptidoglycan-binding domain-containing protein [Limosilactobacillus albertensis]MCD7119036.1 LysM peptidoglycan-binding domain-containing protein [Limosilactobacillus albertensis]MCD7121389.1 LysM peptidoglycan-binding domain-containing protein [Limosilactobacillus albertensis]MCD7129514.1 